MRVLSKIESLIVDFLLSQRPRGKKNYSRKDIVEIIENDLSIESDNPSEILYDELHLLRVPRYIQGYHVAYSTTLDKLHVSKIMQFEELENIQRTHDETIDNRISKRINSLTPRAFEYYIGQIMRKSTSPKFNQVRVSPATRDGGIDVSATIIQEDLTENRVVVEAKKWAGPIGPAIVDRLVQVMERESERHNSSVKGIIISLNGATAGAREAAKGKDIEFWDIHTMVRIAKEIELGVKYIRVPVIDDEWDAYDIEN